MNNFWRVTLGLVISALCLWFVFRGFDVDGFKQIIVQVQWSYVAIAFVVYIAGHIFRSARWHFLLSPVQSVSPVKLFPVLMFGFFINSVMPARAGEFARAMALKRETSIELPTALSSIAMDRVFDVIGFFSLIFLGYTYLPEGWLNPQRMFLVGVLGVVTLGVIFMMRTLISEKHLQHALVKKVHNIFIQINLGLRSLSSPKIIIMAAVITVIIVACEVVNIFLLSRALNVPLTFVQAATLLLAIAFGVAIPAGPGSVGTFELFSKQLLVSMKLSPTLALSFLLFLHTYYILINCGLGLFYLLPNLFLKKEKVFFSKT